MKDFDVDKIIGEVHAALGDISQLHDLPEKIHAAIHGEQSEGEEDIEQEFAVGKGATLSLTDLHGGDVRIRAGEGAAIKVRASKNGALETSTDTPLDASQTGTTVSIRPRGRWHGQSIDCEVEVPSDCAVQVRGINPEVTVIGTGGPLDIQTVSGDVNVEDVTGACTLRTVSGEITGQGIRGTLTVQTTSGDTEIHESQLDSFFLRSISGDFTIETSLTLDSAYGVSTTSGDLHLLLCGDTGATIKFKSMSGEVICKLPSEIIESGRRRWHGRVQGGGATLEMSTMSGNLLIEAGTGRVDTATPDAVAVPSIPFTEATATTDSASAAVPSLSPDVAHDLPPTLAPSVPSAPGEPGPANAADRTGEILGALERGEITVEEAMAKLDSLE